MMELSPLALAYLGDAVFELLVREKLVSGGQLPIKDLNDAAKLYVTAAAQKRFYFRIYDQLTEKERLTLKSGRNSKPHSKSKNASVTDYRHANGMETLFGYLYLLKEYERIKEIFAMCTPEGNSDESESSRNSERSE
ncbi:MAG: Mini-ribonuclease 3 [Clostridiales bacterium]|jgi:ribonuclease-3 family protein|nr:Mini-ribonuclease 3 [Clostridiales bacterium]